MLQIIYSLRDEKRSRRLWKLSGFADSFVSTGYWWHGECFENIQNFITSVLKNIQLFYLFLNTALARVIINAAVGTLERSELEEFVSNVAYKLNKPRATNPKGNTKKQSRGPHIDDGDRY